MGIPITLRKLRIGTYIYYERLYYLNQYFKN
jgi:hypothetical protein